jgi:cyanophycin synthetase
VVRLKHVINDNNREENSPALQSVCPELARTGAEAAATVGLRFAGVDVITSDPTVALRESGGAILEVNHGPGLYYHYMNSGAGTPIAKMILERLMGQTPS